MESSSFCTPESDRSKRVNVPLEDEQLRTLEHALLPVVTMWSCVVVKVSMKL